MRLRVLPEAEAELAAAVEWYEDRRVGLGVDLVALIDQALERITESPDTFPVWKSGYPYRKLVLRRFPYIVFFTVDNVEITIVAFAHGKRRPGYWIDRT